MELIDVLKSSNENVKKFVFGDGQKLVESVLYKYPDYKTRTTICISTQSGCRVGCSFCGTGKKFVCDLTDDEIISQITHILLWQMIEGEEIPIGEIEKFQIMFMSMGEPSHNWKNLESAMRTLHQFHPTAELLVSTIGTDTDNFLNGMIQISKDIPQVGLQFSIHHFLDEKRNLIIPFKDKMTLQEISDYGKRWHEETGRKPFCNYVITATNNDGYERLFDLFPPDVFSFTFSVLCSPNETISGSLLNNKDNIQKIHDDFLNRGYNVRIFDPAGQDDIGGGCGQLWYFQKFINKKETL